LSSPPQPNSPLDAVYRRRPLSVVDGIPVFSKADRYVDNYERIAHDHLAATAQGEGNPNIDESLWLQMEESTRKLVAKHATEGATILDAGVGLGRVLGPLPSVRRFGVDISLSYLRIARENGFDVAFSRLEDLPYHDSSFDMIVACDVLEHVLDLYAVSKELVRVLAPKGTLIVRVPYLDDLNAYLNEDLAYEFIHLRSFDLPSLRLHFGKIFGLAYVEHSLIAPYLKGHPRMKLKLLPEGDPARKFSLESQHPALETLRRATTVSAEDYMNWLYKLRDEEPLLYGTVASQLVEPLEINVVFKKQ